MYVVHMYTCTCDVPLATRFIRNIIGRGDGTYYKEEDANSMEAMSVQP
jgi:hypothetical protein